MRMANYNQTTQEIARPSELLVGITAYTTSLQSLSSYINVDVTRLVKSVLLQQTRPQDARGAQTITTLYTNWCVCHILYGILVNTYISNCSAFIAHANQVSIVQVLFISFCYFLFYLCFGLFIFLSVNHTALHAMLTFVCQVPGEPAASSQQLSHHPLPYAALLCQPEHRQRAKFQSGGIFRCSRSDPELITVYYSTESLHLTLLFLISGFY